jgi:hypothetical protein
LKAIAASGRAITPTLESAAPQAESDVIGIGRLARTDRRSRLVALAIVLVTLLLATCNLEFYPRAWFDEGCHVHVAKALVEFGRYADYSSEGFRYDSATFGVGPTVLMPIALAFAAFGVGLLQARLVMAAYLIICALFYFRVTQHLFGRWVALLATLFLLTTPSLAFVETGRQVIGEVPALAWFLIGADLWFRALDSSRRRYLVAGGIAWGLAMITKSHYALLLPPAIVILAILDLHYLHRLPLRRYLIPLGVALAICVAWYGGLVLYNGAQNLAADTDRLRAASIGAIFAFSLPRAASALKLLLSPEALFGWTIPGLVFGLISSLDRRSDLAPKLGLLSLFAAVWTCWFALASIAWPRYAFAGLAIAFPFAAKLLADLVGDRGGLGVLASLRHPARLGARDVRSACVLLLIAVMVTYQLVWTIRPIVAEPDRSPQEFARLLNDTVRPDATIETWEAELGTLTDHHYHFPPARALDAAVQRQWLDPDAAQARVTVEAEYLVVGRLGKWTGLYGATLATGRYALVASVGEYDLYQAAPTRAGDR